MSTAFRERLHVSAHRQEQLVRILQLLMVGILAIGLYVGNSGVATNAAVGLLVTQLPAIFNRRFDVTMDVGLVLWITIAMFLHAFGTLPLPGFDMLSPYQATDWWDHMTHALSSSLVAGTAYAVSRALDEHTDSIVMPPKFMFVYLLLFVMAFGVVWELVEFAIAEGAKLFGIPEILTQYGLGDTVLDLFYNTMGGVLVAVFGTVHLTGLSDQLSARLDARSADK